MEWASAFSDKENFEENIKFCISQIEEQLEAEPDAVFVYFGTSFSNFADEVYVALHNAFPEANIAAVVQLQ